MTYLSDDGTEKNFDLEAKEVADLKEDFQYKMFEILNEVGGVPLEENEAL